MKKISPSFIIVFCLSVLFLNSGMASMNCSNPSWDNTDSGFLNTILEEGEGNFLTYLKLHTACGNVEMFGTTYDFRGGNTNWSKKSRALGLLQATGLAFIRASLISATAESDRVTNIIKAENPELVSHLDRAKSISNQLLRMKTTYNIMQAFFKEHTATYTSNSMLEVVLDRSTEPHKVLREIKAGNDVGICTHFSSVINWALNYVGSAKGVSGFDVRINAGNGHAWNNVRFIQNGVYYNFDLEPQKENFVPLSTMAYDETLPFSNKRDEVLRNCQAVRDCLERNLNPQNSGMVCDSIGVDHIVNGSFSYQIARDYKVSLNMIRERNFRNELSCEIEIN